MAFVKLNNKDLGICTLEGPMIAARSNDLGIWCGSPAGMQFRVSRRVRDTEHPQPDKPTPLPLLDLTRDSSHWDCRKQAEGEWKEGEIKIVADEMDPKSPVLYLLKIKRFYIGGWELRCDGATRDEVIDITAWKLNMQAQFGSDKQQEEFNPVSDSVAMS